MKKKQQQQQQQLQLVFIYGSLLRFLNNLKQFLFNHSKL